MRKHKTFCIHPKPIRPAGCSASAFDCVSHTCSHDEKHYTLKVIEKSAYDDLENELKKSHSQQGSLREKILAIDSERDMLIEALEHITKRPFGDHSWAISRAHFALDKIKKSNNVQVNAGIAACRACGGSGHVYINDTEIKCVPCCGSGKHQHHLQSGEQND